MKNFVATFTPDGNLHEIVCADSIVRLVPRTDIMKPGPAAMFWVDAGDGFLQFLVRRQDAGRILGLTPGEPFPELPQGQPGTKAEPSWGESLSLEAQILLISLACYVRMFSGIQMPADDPLVTYLYAEFLGELEEVLLQMLAAAVGDADRIGDFLKERGIAYLEDDMRKIMASYSEQ